MSASNKKQSNHWMNWISAHKWMILMAIALITVGSVITFFILHKNSPENTYNDYLSKVQIRLSADKTSFFTGDEATANFTVVIPGELSAEKIEIRDRSGKKITSVNSKDMTLDKSGDLTCSIPVTINTESDGMQTFTAEAGEYVSSELSVFVTPPITPDQVKKSFEVGSDVSDFLSENYSDEEDGDKLAKAAEKYLKKDKRVREVAVRGTNVYYSTVDKVAGLISCAPRDPDSLGMYDATDSHNASVRQLATPVGYAASPEITSTPTHETPFSENSNLIKAYQSSAAPTGLNDYIDSGNTGTNGNVLILRPATNAFVTLPANNRLKAGANKIKNAAGGEIVTEKKDDEAVRAILTRKLSDYGTIVLHGHGGVLPDDDGNIISNVFLLYKAYLDQIDDTIEDTPTQLYNKMTEYAAIAYPNQNGHEPTAEDLQAFCSNYYGQISDVSQWRVYPQWSTVAVRKNDRKKPIFESEIVMTSRYFMELYNDVMFDNAVMIFGTCNALYYDPFNEWLINHGFKMVLGYEGTINNALSLYNFSDVIDELTDISDTEKWRTQTPDETTRKNDNKSIINLPENITQEFVLKNLNQLTHGSDHMLFLGNPDFYYAGTGSIRGKVMYKENDSDNAAESPCAKATITAYLYHNKQFVEQKKVQTNQNGEFVLLDIKCGAYVLKIKDASGSGKTVSIVADQKENDGGCVYLEKKADGSKFVGKAVSYEDAVYYTGIGMIDADYYSVPLELCCYKNGKETVLLDVNRTFTDGNSLLTIYGDIAIANGKIYFWLMDWEGDSCICSYNIKTKKAVRIKGTKNVNDIVGLSSDGKYLVFCKDDTENSLNYQTYYVLNTEDESPSVTKGKQNCSIALRNGVLYYSQYNPSKKTYDVFRAAPDGADATKLGSFKAPKMINSVDGEPFYPTEFVFRTVNDVDTLYFAYRLSYTHNDAKSKIWIAKVNLDTAESKLIINGKKATEFKDFIIHDDGSVSSADFSRQWDEKVYYHSDDNCYYVMNQDDLYSVSRSDGKATVLLRKSEYEKYCKDDSETYLANICFSDNKAYIEIRLYGDYENDIPPSGFLLEKDLKTGKVTLISKYKRYRSDD